MLTSLFPSAGTSKAIDRNSKHAGLEVFGLFLASLAVSMVNDKLCFLVLGGGAVGLVYRYRNSPATVVGTIFAVFCMAPLFRRLYDMNHGFSYGSPILIAPHLATPLLGLLVVLQMPRMRDSIYAPMFVSSLGLVFSYSVGVLGFGLFQASIQLLQYVSGPIVFAYLVLNGSKLDAKLLIRWILALGFLCAVYGMYQWVSPPPWDVAWFLGAKMDTAGGKPFPFEMRTFGTLNSCSPFAYFMFFTLVVPVNAPAFKWAGPVMIAALATTLGRSVWGATALGWFLCVLLAKGRDMQKVVMSLVAMLFIVSLFALPFADRLTSMVTRLSTVTNIQQDNSFRDRTALLDAALNAGAFDNPFGVGLGGSGDAARQGENGGLAGIDNGFLQMVWLFGWWGTLLYLGGFGIILLRGFLNLRSLVQEEIQFLAAATALFAANIFESAFEGIKGEMLWASLAVVSVGILRARTKA